MFLQIHILPTILHLPLLRPRLRASLLLPSAPTSPAPSPPNEDQDFSRVYCHQTLSPPCISLKRSTNTIYQTSHQQTPALKWSETLLFIRPPNPSLPSLFRAILSKILTKIITEAIEKRVILSLNLSKPHQTSLKSGLNHLHHIQLPHLGKFLDMDQKGKAKTRLTSWREDATALDNQEKPQTQPMDKPYMQGCPTSVLLKLEAVRCTVDDKNNFFGISSPGFKHGYKPPPSRIARWMDNGGLDPSNVILPPELSLKKE